jgi:hypothetical protein
MRIFRNAFVGSLLVFLPAAFILALHMETAGKWDSIGTWYTIYTATCIALPAALIVAVVAKVMLSQWRSRG